MERLFSHLQCFLIASALLGCSVASHADFCTMFHERASVRAVCGRIINIAGEKLNNVDLTLTGETGSVLFTTRSDTKGSFSFGSNPRGDYTLHAEAHGYRAAERELSITNEKQCSPKIEVKLGFGSCDTGTYVKGVDKPSDLESELGK